MDTLKEKLPRVPTTLRFLFPSNYYIENTNSKLVDFLLFQNMDVLDYWNKILKRIV